MNFMYNLSETEYLVFKTQLSCIELFSGYEGSGELKKCWKKGRSGYHGTFTHRRTVIDGIKLRAKEIFPNEIKFKCLRLAWLRIVNISLVL